MFVESLKLSALSCCSVATFTTYSKSESYHKAENRGEKQIYLIFSPSYLILTHIFKRYCFTFWPVKQHKNCFQHVRGHKPAQPWNILLYSCVLWIHHRLGHEGSKSTFPSWIRTSPSWVGTHQWPRSQEAWQPFSRMAWPTEILITLQVFLPASTIATLHYYRSLCFGLDRLIWWRVIWISSLLVSRLVT